MVVENKYKKELLEIFDENHQGYLTDRTATQRDMLTVVYEEDNKPLGYAVVYIGGDFYKKEKYPITLNNIEDNCAYIWQIVTKKGYEKRGIATQIVSYITEKYKDRDIYVAVDIENHASMRCQCKCGFIPILYFETKAKHLLLKKKKSY